MNNGKPEAPPLGQWTTGLCGCFEDPGNCCVTSCYPSVTLANNAEIIDEGGTTSAALTFYTHSQGGSACSICLYSSTYRSKLRGIFPLPEEPCPDSCVHCWCAFCALCQEHRELKNRGLDTALGWSANEDNMKRAKQVPPQVATGMTR